MFVRGIAIILILLHHIAMNMTGVPILLKAMFVPMGSLGTAIFFMLSGYGNYFSLKNGTRTGWLKRRTFRLLISFVVIFIFNYLFVRLLVPSVYIDNNIKSWFISFITLSLIPWTNWFIKIQLLVYVIYYLVTSKPIGIERGNYLIMAILTLYSIICFSIGVPDYWWTSSICYPLGSLVAANKERLLKCIKGKKGKYVTMNVLLFCVLIILEYKVNIGIAIFANIAGCILVILLSSILKLDSVFLRWIGTFSLELYLSQVMFLTIAFDNTWSRNIQASIVLILSIPVGISTYKIAQGFSKLIERGN